MLKDDIIPYAIKWFTGEAQMEDSDEEYDDEDDEDDEGAVRYVMLCCNACGCDSPALCHLAPHV